MKPSTASDLYLSLDEKAFDHSQTMSDFDEVATHILDTLDVEHAEGVDVQFDNERCIARIRGLQTSDHDRIAQLLPYNAVRMGKIRLIPDPESEAGISENGS